MRFHPHLDPRAPVAVLLLLCALIRVEAARADETQDEVETPPSVSAPGAVPGPEATDRSPWNVLSLLGTDVAPGDKQRLFLEASESFAGASVEIPILVARGLERGPTLCLTAGVHGDELNGIEIVRQSFENLTPRSLSGMVIAIPVANLHGFRRSSRYLPDRRDLNRFFPGHPAGSSASRIANAIFDGVVRRCHVLVDLHTGSFHRTNLPQIRADLGSDRILALASAFGVGVVVHSAGGKGTLRRAAGEAGIDAVTYEAGEPLRFQRDEISRGVDGVRNLMAYLGMLQREAPALEDARVYRRSRWVRVNDGGIFLTDRSLGDRVRIGDDLGTVTDPVSNERSRILSPLSGRIIGMAVSQVVIPGFAAFHIGIDQDTGLPLPEPDRAEPPGEPPASLAEPGRLDAEENPE